MSIEWRSDDSGPSEVVVQAEGAGRHPGCRNSCWRTEARTGRYKYNYTADDKINNVGYLQIQTGDSGISPFASIGLRIHMLHNCTVQLKTNLN